MKSRLLILIFGIALPAMPQSLQLHYDFRHSLDPARNAKNFPTLYYEYFKGNDSGSFLLKMQSDFSGRGNNIGQFYSQISQSFRFWEPKICAQVEYSGGLGIVEPGSFGYYLANTLSLGCAYPFQWEGGFFYAAASCSYTAMSLPSYDPLFSIYWWKGLWKYRVEFCGDIEVWTQNRSRGIGSPGSGTGKSVHLYGQPQLWLKLTDRLSVGTKLSFSYHVVADENVLLFYPTAAMRYKI